MPQYDIGVTTAAEAIRGRVALRAPGRGVLEVVRQGGRSVVGRAYATSPLRLLTPGNHGDAAWIYTSTFGGGLLDGDDIDLTIDVGPGASAFVSTQASSKVYRSTRGSQTRVDARVGDGGLLAIAPDPVVCFADSRYRQAQQFEVDGDGGLVLLDWFTSGRRARGERWAFDEYRSLIEVRVQERLILHDALTLRSDDGDLAERMGRFDVIALLVVAGGLLGAEARRLVETLDDVPVARRADRLIAATAIGDDGCMVRLAGRSVEEAAGLFREWLSFVPALLGDDPWVRKW